MKNVFSYLEEILNINDKIVIAVSGGPDSMALLDMVNTLKESKNLEIICAHVNHNKREASEAEKKLVADYCLSHNITFEYTKFVSYAKGNFQEIARKKRYEFFEKILKKYDAHILMTAHHGDDLAETILMRISRGSTLKGYSGFSKMTNNEWYSLIRPLVYTTKAEIIEYINNHNIPYATDSSNEEDNYTRNRYRHHVLNQLKLEEPNITTKFLNFSEKIDEAANYIDEVVKEKLQNLYQDSVLDIVKFTYEKKYIQKMIITKILSDIYDDDVVFLKEKHVDMILSAVDSYRPNLEVVLPKRMRVIKKYDKLIFTTELEQRDKYSYLFDEEVVIGNHKIVELEKIDSDGNDVCRLSIQDVQLPLYIRNRQNGDKMTIKGMEGTKKIKEIFIEQKIPKEEREQWPILVDSRDQILWLPGLKKSKYNKQKNENCDIILKYN